MFKIKLKLFLLILILFSAIPVFAKERIIDNAGLLSSSQKASLNSKINSISEQYKFDLVIVTERNIESGVSFINYAEEFFFNNDYGFGQNKDGCLLLQVNAARDYSISNFGRSRNILNDYAFNKLESDIVKHLGEGNTYAAYSSFLDNWEEFLILDTKWSRSYNFFHQWNAVLVIIAWAIALAIGFITVHSWKSSMNTAIKKTQASSYIVPGSITYSVKNDSFLYSTVTKTPRQTDNNSSGAGRNITSTSGRSTGRSGKY